MTSATVVAQAFLDLASSEGRQLTNMQLQKLVFFAHGAHLAAYDEPLIHEPVKAWDFGPVIPSLYERLREYGSGPVYNPIDYFGANSLGPREQQAVRSAWRAYGHLDAWQLSDITHQQGSPWEQVWNNGGRYSDIPDYVTHRYYQNRISRGGGSAWLVRILEKAIRRI